jgi:hypothetical protein
MLTNLLQPVMRIARKRKENAATAYSLRFVPELNTSFPLGVENQLFKDLRTKRTTMPTMLFLTAAFVALYWWARYRSIRAINAAIAGFGLQERCTALAVIVVLTGIQRHTFAFCMATFRAGNF